MVLTRVMFYNCVYLSCYRLVGRGHTSLQYIGWWITIYDVPPLYRRSHACGWCAWHSKIRKDENWCCNWWSAKWNMIIGSRCHHANFETPILWLSRSTTTNDILKPFALLLFLRWQCAELALTKLMIKKYSEAFHQKKIVNLFLCSKTWTYINIKNM